MIIVVASGLTLLALLFVLFPIYQQWRQHAAPDVALTPTSAIQKEHILVDQEQNARQALQEVEFDYQLGNMDDADYQDLHERYMQRAVAALKLRHEREQEIDEEIEAQLRQMKEGLSNAKNDTNA